MSNKEKSYIRLDQAQLLIDTAIRHSPLWYNKAEDLAQGDDRELWSISYKIAEAVLEGYKGLDS